MHMNILILLQKQCSAIQRTSWTGTIRMHATDCPKFTRRSLECTLPVKNLELYIDNNTKESVHINYVCRKLIILAGQISHLEQFTQKSMLPVPCNPSGKPVLKNGTTLYGHGASYLMSKIILLQDAVVEYKSLRLQTIIYFFRHLKRYNVIIRNHYDTPYTR